MIEGPFVTRDLQTDDDKIGQPCYLQLMRLHYYFFALLIFSVVSLEARVDRRPACYKNLERHFFDKTITSNAFSLYSVRQGGWTAMLNELQHRSETQVSNMVWNVGMKMRPNPLDTFYKPGPAGEILGSVLFKVFHSVCVDYSVTSESVIRNMFQYIEQEQAPKIRSCFGRDTFTPTKDKEKQP